MKLGRLKTLLPIILLLVVGLILRLKTAGTLPLTNDEGSYLYDAFLLGTGHLPFATSFSRAPSLMVPLAIWLKVFGVSVFAGRLFAIITSLGSAITIYFIGKHLKGQKFGLLALALFCAVSSAVVHGSYLLTQNWEIFYSLLGSYLLLKAWVNIKSNFLQFAASGVFFGLAVCARETAAVYPLFLAVILLLEKRQPPTNRQILGIGLAAIVTTLTWGVIWGVIASQIGLPHVIKNFEALLTMHKTGERLTLGFVMRSKISEFFYLRVDYGLFYFLSIAFAALTLIKGWYKEKKFWVLGALAFGPIIFYGFYYKRLQPEYFASFIPGFVLISAFVLDYFRSLIIRRKLFIALFILLFAGANLSSFRYQLANPRGGTFYLKPLDIVVSWIKENTKPTDEIFTAAVAIPLLSNRPLALNISRPVIFGYPHIATTIKYALFPTPEEIMSYLDTHQVPYYVVEKSTRDSFYTGHDELQEYLFSHYRYLKTFDNPTNPIEIWTKL